MLVLIRLVLRLTLRKSTCYFSFFSCS